MAVDLRQKHFRFGYDNGTEITHGWIAAEDANPTAGLIIPGMRFLLRICEDEDGGTAAPNIAAQLQYKLNGGSWTNVTTSSSVVNAVAVNAFGDADNCTQRLSGTGTFETSGAGCSDDGLSGGNANDIVASGNSETEYGLQIVAADVAPDDVIYFQIVTTPTGISAYDVFPAVTIATDGYELTAQAAQAASTANPVTMSFDCAGGDLLVVKVFTISATRGGAVPTFNSVNMTDSSEGSVSSGSEANVELFYLASPSSGAQTISVPNTGGAGVSLIVSAWSGVDTTDPFDTSNSALNAGSANPSCAITTGAAGKLIVDAMMGGLLTLPTANSDIQISGSDLGAYTISSQFSLRDGSAGITLSYTLGSDDWAMIVISFNPALTGTTYYGTLTCTAVGSAVFARKLTFKRTLSTTAVGVVLFSRLMTLYRILSTTAIGVANFSRQTNLYRTLYTTAVGIADFIRQMSFFRSLNVTAIGVASFSTVMIKLVTLAVTAVGVTSFSRQTNLYRTLSTTAIGVPNFIRKMTFKRTLATTAIGIADFTRLTTLYRTLSTTAIGVADFTHKMTFKRTLATTAIGVVNFTRQTNLYRTLSTTAVGVASFVRHMTFKRLLSVTAIGVADLQGIVSGGTTYYGTLAVTAIGVAGFNTAMTFKRTLAATAVGVVNFNRLMTQKRSLAVTAVGTVQFNRFLQLYRTLNITALAVPLFSRKLTLYRTLNVTATGVVDFVRKMTFKRALSVVATGIATLTGLTHVPTTYFVTLAVTAVGSAKFSTNWIFSSFYKRLVSLIFPVKNVVTAGIITKTVTVTMVDKTVEVK